MDTKIDPNIDKTDSKYKIDFLKSVIPILDEFIELIENHKGWLPLNEQALEFILNLPFPWCTLYEDKEHLQKLIIYLSFYDEDKDEVSLDDYSENELILESTEFLNLPDDILNFTEDDKLEAEIEFNNLPQDKKDKRIQYYSIFIYVLIAQFFNYLALMIHGRSMHQLITDAKNGDDYAYCLAAQIDRTVLQLPCFQKRLLKAQFSNDEIFLNKLATRIKTPIIQSKIRYRTLMLAFAMLDDLNMMHLPHEKLLDICEEIGVTGDEHGINDIDKFRKRLHEYKKIKRN